MLILIHLIIIQTNVLYKIYSAFLLNNIKIRGMTFGHILAILSVPIVWILHFIIKKMSPMFAKFLLGWAGLIIAILGIILLIGGFRNDDNISLYIGIGLLIAGGYMKYLSRHAVTVENPIKIKKSFSGNKNLDDESYELYLVEKYSIKKNDTLNKFVLNDKPYSDLKEALKVAHNLETDK